MKESIIGMKYIPFDNSFSVNLTSCCDYPYLNKQKYLGGTYNTSPKTCTIVSEPFSVNTRINALDKDYIYQMIAVEYNNETHVVLFNKNNICNK